MPIKRVEHIQGAIKINGKLYQHVSRENYIDHLTPKEQAISMRKRGYLAVTRKRGGKQEVYARSKKKWYRR